MAKTRSKKPQQLNAAVYEQVAKNLLKECVQIARKHNLPVKQFCKKVADRLLEYSTLQRKLECEAALNEARCYSPLAALAKHERKGPLLTQVTLTPPRAQESDDGKEKTH